MQIVSIGQEVIEIQNSVPGCISSSEPKHCHPVQPFKRHWSLRLKYLNVTVNEEIQTANLLLMIENNAASGRRRSTVGTL